MKEVDDRVAEFGRNCSGFTFELAEHPEESFLTLFVSWKRDKRISITIRHVPVKVPDLPEDPTL